MKDIRELKECLDSIRATLDTDVLDLGIDATNSKLIALTQLMGLSAECNSMAKKYLGLKELEVFSIMDKSLSPSMQSKFLKASCNEEESVLEYADRLNASIVHCCESLRTSISLYKTELQVSNFQSKQTK